MSKAVGGNRLVGLVVKVSPSRAANLGSISALGVDLFLGRATSVTGKMVVQWLPCQVPGVTRATQGLVDPVSVY